MNKYEAKIVNALLKKYYRRKAKHKNEEIHRRIDLSVDKILKDYSNYNVDLGEKDLVNKAVKSLESKGYITSLLLKFSDDYQKVYLVEDNVAFLEKYAAKELGIIPRTFVVDELKTVIKTYKGNDEITDYYIEDLENKILNSSVQLDFVKETDTLKVLSFLERNNEFLYLREVSMLIFGDSKYLENNTKQHVSAVLLSYFSNNGEEVFEDENLFERFNIYDTDQDVCIKGPVLIEADEKHLDIDGLNGGVSFSIKDIDKIRNITVKCEKVITVENKTSFLRMGGDCCYIYLGGFATKPQIAFIKKLINDNPDKGYLHFGDIDAGGFLIHKKLCEQTGRHFILFHMSKRDLENKEYTNCLKTLTEIDKKRLSSLKDESDYTECIEYMLKTNVKLEQEIISLCVSGKL